MMSGTMREDNLLPLFEAVSLKNVQLQQAIRVGDDRLVRLLDRELDPLIAAVVNYKATDPHEIHLQLRFMSSLIREDADDKSCVVRHAAVLSVLLDRYFGDEGSGTDQLRESKAELDAARHMVGDDNLLNESILNSLPEQVAVITTDYRYLYSNPAHAEFMKCRPLDLIGRHVADYLGDAEFETTTRSNLDRCFDGEAVSYTFWRREEGQRTLVRCQMTPFRTDDGKIIGAVAMIQCCLRAAGDMAA
ncbi:MAG: PAS domain-containing protein [Allorhizobium sp.]